MKKVLAKFLIVSLLMFSFPQPLNSANLSAVTDTLSTSRLSYYDHLSSLHLLGTSLISVTTSGNLFTGDTVLIGDTTTATTYTVDDIYSATQFTTTAGLDATDIQSGDTVVATRSASHTVTFTTATAVSNGAIRIKIPAGTTAPADGLPDHDGFDFTFGGVGIGTTAPTGGGVTSWETATATASGGTGCSTGYHCFEARYNGTNDVNAALTFYIYGLINPAPNHAAVSAGSADTYTVIVQHLKDRTAGNDYAVLDSTSGKIALVESVRVTATVDPTITFTIASVGVGETACGVAASVTTTATTVPFGTMALNTFKNLAHKLTLSTNAVGGGAVTAGENDHLGKDGGTTPFIVDSSGDSPSTMDEQTTEDWDTATNNGFGYSLDDAGDGSADVTEAFTYNVASGNCSVGTYCARQFANLAHADTVKELFNSAGTTIDAGDAFVCYRLSVNSAQAAGDYENNITYTATATF